jgi:hypothetical protein
MRPLSALGRSVVWLSIYVLCVVFVCSFILFEVLDIDGSDFPIGSAPTAVRAVEPPHDEIKRALLQTASDLHVLAAVPATRQRDCVAALADSTALQPSPFLSPQAYKRLLPRASLSDIPPSA